MATLTNLAWADVNEGDTVTPLTFPVTMRTLMIDVAGSRDLYPIHHDREFAKKNGARDIFVNTMWYQALFGRIVTDWAGPEAFLRRMRFSMRLPNCPGDTITSSGTVVKKYEENGEKLVDIEVHLSNQLGPDTTISQMTVRLA